MIYKVTICVPTYNQSAYIEQCLNSLISQDFDFPYQILVGDDCSTDGTQEILKNFSKSHPEKVSVIFRSENIGPYRNFVDLHNQANSEFVCHCDGDDVFYPNKLKEQVVTLEKFPQVNVCWSRADLFNENGLFVSGDNLNYDYFKDKFVEAPDAFMIGAVGMHCTCMYRRSARKTTEPFPEKIDIYYIWEFLSTGKGIILDSRLAAYRVSAQGAISVNQSEKILSIYCQHAEHYRQRYPRNRTELSVFLLFNFLLAVKSGKPVAFKILSCFIKTMTVRTPLVFLKMFPILKNYGIVKK